jgi:uncharacterized repeat protein (TIGR03803 family)
MRESFRAVAAAAITCGVAVIATGASIPTFRILFNGANSAGAEPTAIAQITPDTFLWDASGGGILSVTKSKQTAVLAVAPSNGSVSPPISAANGRGYTEAGNNSANYLVSFTTQPNSAITYSNQAIGAILTANLPNGSLLGFGNDASGYNNLIIADLQGNVSSVYRFPANEVSMTPPFPGADGNYYGVSLTRFGPPQGNSYVYQVTPAGILTKLADLPYGSFFNLNWVPSLFQASDGNFYGDTITGGNGYGTFYRLTPSGQYTLLYTFPSKSRSSFPGSMFQASDGNFYGVTNGCCSGGEASPGTIFMLTPALQYTTLLVLNNDKGICPCTLIQGSDGNLYGTTGAGGLGGVGTIFEYELGLPVPAPQARNFHPASGGPGTKVRIWGNNLLEASVTFNGAAATDVHSSGPNYVWATVPSGATSGPITVTTAGGTSTTAASFTVQ